jgi:hypothetical protein
MQKAFAGNAFTFELVADGTVVPDHAASLFLTNGSASAVDVLIGFNTDEGTIFTDDTHASAVSFFAAIFGNDTCSANAALKQFSPALYDSNYQANAAGLATYFFQCPSNTLLRGVQAKRPSGKFYAYMFAHTPSWFATSCASSQSPSTDAFCAPLGVMHGADVPFVFGHSLHAFTPEEQGMSDNIIAAWVAFASTGNPGDFWPAWEPVNQMAMLISTDPSPISLNATGACSLFAPNPPPCSVPAAAITTGFTTLFLQTQVAIDGYSSVLFGAPQRAAFINGTAAVLSIAAADVRLGSVSDFTPPGRHLLTVSYISLNVTIAVANPTAAAAVGSAFTAAFYNSGEAFTAALVSAGLTQTTGAAVLVAPAAATIYPPPPGPPPPRPPPSPLPPSPPSSVTSAGCRSVGAATAALVALYTAATLVVATL